VQEPLPKIQQVAVKFGETFTASSMDGVKLAQADGEKDREQAWSSTM
jgi:hypothetical protein